MTTTKTESGKVYSLFNASGQVEEIKPVDELPIGTKIFAFGAGMSQTIYCITSGKNSNGDQDICLISRYWPDSYFSSPKMEFDKYSRPLSKKFGIGLYWDDVKNEVYPESKVKAAIRRADYLTRKIAKQKQDKENADKRDREELPAKFQHLTPLNNGGEAKKNLIADLKKNFPNVKFSVKKEHYGTYYVRWQDGPTVEEVAKITGKFESYETDFTGDFRDYNPSNFNLVFGGFKYVFESRKMSEPTRESLTKIAEQIKEENKEKGDYIEQITHRLFSRYSFAPGAIITGFIRNEKTCANDYTEFYDLILEEVTPPAQKIGNIELVEYSHKAMALFGDTKPIKEQLKSLGGRFNPHLTHNGVKCAGWIFSKKQKEQLTKLLSN